MRDVTEPMIEFPDAYDFADVLAPAPALLIVPPFSHWNYGSLGCHVLQACAREAGVRVSVLYTNILLAAAIGESHYKSVAFDYSQLIGERLFARAAYDRPPFGKINFQYRYGGPKLDDREKYPLTQPVLEQIETETVPWLERIADSVVALGFRFVGATSSFQQTAASIALLRAIKTRDPDIVTFIGGANCDGPMGPAVLSCSKAIDYVFSGESEKTLPTFLRDAIDGHLPKSPVLRGEPCQTLDLLPSPSYAEYYAQVSRYLPQEVARNRVWISYESSRGCWWGQKHHCTFCGLNGTGMGFREKSPERVLTELAGLVRESPTQQVMTADNILPHSYFRTLVPQLAETLPGLFIHYEVKANLSLEKLSALKRAGIRKIQPGIEAFSTPLLQKMRKGVTGAQNLRLLRWCRSLDIHVRWNLLCDFPGDRIEDYELTLALVPYLHHLPPPTGIFPLSIDRFSPYFENPAAFGISHLAPESAYEDLYPTNVNLSDVAYHFRGDYVSASREFPELIREISHCLDRWRAAWFTDSRARPELAVHQLSEQVFALIDTRLLDNSEALRILSIDEAQTALGIGTKPGEESTQRLVDENLGAIVDGLFVSFVTATERTLATLSAGSDSPLIETSA